MKLQPRDCKHHVLQHVYHDHHARREQLWPRPQIGSRLARDVHLPSEPQDPTHDPASDELTCPGHHTSVHGEGEAVVVAASNRVCSGIRFASFGVLGEREIGVDILVGAIVQDENGAEEGEHADGFGERADERVPGAEFPVRG
jgi:hypothetical protein